MNQEISFYIPRVSVSYTAENIKYIFRASRIGEVKRVDFVSITPRENMVSNSTANDYQSAFIHISYMYESDIAKVIMKYITDGSPYKFWVRPGLFWLILKNTNPVPETRQNIHQLAENARLLEERVVKQEQQIAKQSVEIIRLQETVYQLIGHVFDHRTQGTDIFGNINNMLYGKFYTKRWLYDENDNGDDDENESAGQCCYSEVDDQPIYSDSSSTHSSMPALMSNSDLEDDQTTCSSTSYSMPDLIATGVLADTHIDDDTDDDLCSL
jgi:hypothetical protein